MRFEGFGVYGFGCGRAGDSRLGIRVFGVFVGARFFLGNWDLGGVVLLR